MRLAPQTIPAPAPPRLAQPRPGDRHWKRALSEAFGPGFHVKAPLLVIAKSEGFSATCEGR